jgi:hypothetical protein
MDIKLKHSSNDPDYERIEGMRKYRSKNYWANILIVVGIITLFIYGLGIIFIFFGILKKINARHFKTKFRE